MILSSNLTAGFGFILFRYKTKKTHTQKKKRTNKQNLNYRSELLCVDGLRDAQLSQLHALCDPPGNVPVYQPANDNQTIQNELELLAHGMRK